MLKKYFAALILSSFIAMPSIAQDTVFSNSDSEQFNLQPLNYSTKTITSSSSSSALKSTSNTLSDKNFKNAINNLDTAEVEIREQLANYSALMAQSKTNYESKRGEYRTYKKQYNALKRKMRNVEKSKKLIQNNIYVQNSQN
ncbi:MAG: hypothetical protein LUE64_05685 [Candidatus Gastranaerophilales bacterium]|nr:hypothetical protein [Candidatus Gastranaerophilales bacterium]